MQRWLQVIPRPIRVTPVSIPNQRRKKEYNQMKELQWIKLSIGCGPLAHQFDGTGNQ